MNDRPEGPNPNLPETPCLICGSQDFVWGRTVGEHPDDWLYFRRSDASWGEGEKLLARKCQNCNNVQLFTDS